MVNVFNFFSNKSKLRKHEYFSQIGQDKWIINKVFPDFKNGYFLDIGAYDGKKWSNTFTLEKELGWTGIAVEPNANLYKKLVECRSCFCDNNCIGPVAGEVAFVNQGWASGLLAEYSDDLTLHGPADNSQRDIVIKKVITPLELLEKYNAPKTVHYLSLDVEGAEYEILKVFPFKKYIVLSLTVEHNSKHGEKNIEKQKNIRNLLEYNGYKFIKTIEFDDCYVHGSIKRWGL